MLILVYTYSVLVRLCASVHVSFIGILSSVWYNKRFSVWRVVRRAGVELVYSEFMAVLQIAYQDFLSALTHIK